MLCAGPSLSLTEDAELQLDNRAAINVHMNIFIALTLLPPPTTDIHSSSQVIHNGSEFVD